MFLAQSREKHAGKDAVHCKGGCSAVQGRLQCSASEMGKNWYRNRQSIFWISPQKQYWTCARTLYICTTIGGEFTPEKTSSHFLSTLY